MTLQGEEMEKLWTYEMESTSEPWFKYPLSCGYD